MDNIQNIHGNNYFIYKSKLYNDNKMKLPFHGDMKMLKVLFDNIDKFNCFVETGSYMGKTIYFMGKNYPQIECYSCELDKKNYTIAHHNVKNLSNVNLKLEPSPRALYNFDKNDKISEKKCLFWLDAHWHTEPLNDEIYYITKNFDNFCIFVDDFKIPNDPGFHTDGYSIDGIKKYINNKDECKFYIPNYNSSDECCKSNPVGYFIISKGIGVQHNNLKQIFI